mgnify:CR=1 FL=1
MFKEIKIILFTSSLLFCQNPDSLFVKGNNYYNNKDFANAIKSYEDIIDQGLYLSLIQISEPTRRYAISKDVI